MAEISALTATIIKEAENEAKKTIDASKENARKIAEKIANNKKELLEKLKKDANTKNDFENKSFESKRKKLYETAMSRARINFYSQVIDDAKTILNDASPETHLSFVMKILERLNIPDNSEISISAKVPDSDTEKICRKFNLKKGEKINSFGFIITTPTYKDNYTLDSIFEENGADFIKFLHMHTEVK